MVYRSSFVETFLILQYGAKKAAFFSESISAITILKDVISQQASTRNVHINIQWEMNEKSIKNFLELLGPKFEYYQSISKKYQVLTALKEISNQVMKCLYFYSEASLRREIRTFCQKSQEISWKKLMRFKTLISNSQRSYSI